MKCYICNQGPADGKNLFRVNAKGQPGVWACEAHRPPGRTVPEDVRHLEAVLDDDEELSEPRP